jgi:SAM-dependent methyltransferase
VTLWDGVFRSGHWARWPAEEVVRSVSRLAAAIGRPLDVLEVGCGPGAQLWYLEHEGHHAVGLDISAIGLTHARSRLSEEGCARRLVRADAAWLPFRSGVFDLVLDVEAFAHNHEDLAPRLWTEAARVLRPGGHLLSFGFTAATTGRTTGSDTGIRTVTGITVGPLAGYGEVSLVDKGVVQALAKGSGLKVVDAQLRSRTTGPEHWYVEEQVTLAQLVPE